MPHIAVMMYPGRDDEIKTNLSKKIQALVVEELKVRPEVVSVSVFDIDKEAFPKAMENIPEDKIFVGAKK